MSQLTIDGREVETIPSRARLTLTQRMILELVRRRGLIRSTEAGRLMHEARGYCGSGQKSFRYRTAREGRMMCCPYAAADGWDALMRLQARGLVRRTFLRGRWRLP